VSKERILPASSGVHDRTSIPRAPARRIGIDPRSPRIYHPKTAAAQDPAVISEETTMAGPNTLEFNEDNFEDHVLNADVPVLVDFWAEWCGPCQMVGPIIDELATEYEGKIKVGKLDVDQASQIASRYGVQNIPTVVLFDKGEAVERIVGARNKKDYKSVIESKIGTA
jgi:thioredoxin 1